ncbi:MAG: hypothetical protein R2878_07685 [Thermoleophilia bacterium]
MVGDQEALEKATLRAAAAIGAPDGLLVRVVARADDGVVLINLWANPERRQQANDDPSHIAAIVGSGIDEATITRTAESYDVLDFTVARDRRPHC